MIGEEKVMSVRTIPAKNINHYIGKKDAIIVDLRNRYDYERGHIPTAVNIPFHEIQNYKKHFGYYREIILYCERGSLSLLAARQLSDSDQDVFSIYGGIHAYRGELKKENKS